MVEGADMDMERLNMMCDLASANVTPIDGHVCAGDVEAAV